MIKVKDLSQDFQNIYIKYKQKISIKPSHKKTTFDLTNDFIHKKNKKILSKMTTEEVVFNNHIRNIRSNKQNLISDKDFNDQIDKMISRKALKVQKKINNMLLPESLILPKNEIYDHLNDSEDDRKRREISQNLKFENRISVQVGEADKAKRKFSILNQNLNVKMTKTPTGIGERISLYDVEKIIDNSNSNSNKILKTKVTTDKIIEEVNDLNGNQYNQKEGYILNTQKSRKRILFNQNQSQKQRESEKNMIKDMKNISQIEDIYYYSIGDNKILKGNLIKKTKEYSRGNTRRTFIEDNLFNQPSTEEKAKDMTVKESNRKISIKIDKDIGNVATRIDYPMRNNENLYKNKKNLVLLSKKSRIFEMKNEKTRKNKQNRLERIYDNVMDQRKEILNSIQEFHDFKYEVQMKMNFFKKNY